GALHVWLHLPDPWHASQFVSHAKEDGVILSAAHSFSIGRARPPFAVRVCLGPPSTEARLEQGLKILRHVIDEHDPTEDARIM
ncbi:MAG TPA: PLP-dependent aminotransferase family protein, partial [Rhodospirillaceae bacterium]|nr:PLP-dependent aminotransferase family protein [Rhodospirillaceae bacterium]